ncbi:MULTISPECIES: MocR-like pyridoxine biosynthesis transcription factor PdxR [Bacillus]|uniref:MocR-like pyridoxine biosynthesis transcription factor PdxR n=1 Tax=Bacillus TaxID=1386 RepID=UPI0007B6DABF|nr:MULTISPECIES: PLP-dependent aminotransferase family protein [Bacillus]ANC08728.1 GntR family transcriptional regulator [Bacillus cereus]ANC14546.1 GntR family transcriptional regulator [Bacillus cereus]MBZ4223944.1 PLP-dependent aminotransferase family protein [Bacillus wiedmannii]MDA1996538.1 PLP-dependent aminotransferase family protein [Bacillus cereus]MDA2002241.1 PLP-dependent aminotransferase family protein [Bacillus cereus]
MKNFLFTFEKSIPKYKQIYTNVKLLIEKGVLKKDESLPSIRQLADSLNVSRNTTLLAYDQLAAEGYIRGENRRGFFVNELEPNLYQRRKKVKQKDEKQISKEITINFKVDTVEKEMFPKNTWKRFVNHSMEENLLYTYGDPFGEAILRDQVAKYLLESRGLSTDQGSIIIGSSTQQMLTYIGHVLKSDFSSIILEDPGFWGAREVFKLHHFSFEFLPVYENGVELSELSNLKARLIYVTPSHHSPYGVSMSIQQRQQLIQWAKKKKGYIIEDDYDSEFRYTQRPFPSLASIDQNRVIYIGNFSKAFLPGLRLSYMVLPKELLIKYKEHFKGFENTASTIHQIAMAKFMKENEWYRHIKRMRNIYRKKMEHLISTLNEHFGNDITIIGHNSGLYLLIKVHLQKSEDWLIKQAYKNGVEIGPTSRYFVNNYIDRPIIKLAFGGLSHKEITLGVKLLKKAWF